jgi:acetylornithine/succinyldiaminopimelate/putrescine aminotransferase
MITHRNLFLNNLAQTSDFPLLIEIEKAEGVWLYGKNDEKYLDFISGIAVSNVGHRHPKVVQAIKDQADKYMHLMVYGEYVQGPQVLLANKLVGTLSHIPTTKDKIDNVYFTNSGTEAIEGAMKLAKRYTNRSEIISCKNAYHGATQGALSLSGSEHFKQNYRPLLPDIKQIEFANFDDLNKITNKTAAIFMETVQGESGLQTATHEYFKALENKCLATGTLLILDEIQCGCGRTGSFWAFEQYGIYPDVLVAAKGMGGGMPIGAFMANQKVMAVFKNNPILGHITTFGGHPISAAASLATLNVIFEENLLANINQKADRIKSKLVHPKIKAIRNKGLMMAVEFESFEVLKPIIDRAIEKGVITDWFLFCDNSMRIAPPLTITNEEIDHACEVIMSCL